MQKRKRRKQTTSLRQRLSQFAQHARDQALRLPTGKQRDDLLQRASNADNAARLDEVLSSPGPAHRA